MNTETMTHPAADPGSSDDKWQTSRFLLDSALHVFSRRGYRRMTMENVLEHAGISRPTLYKYFRNKHELVVAALIQAGGVLQDRLKASATGNDESLYLMARARLEAYYAWCTEQRELVSQIYREIEDTESPASKVRAYVLSKTSQHWTAALLRHGLVPRDSLEIDSLLFVTEQLTIRYVALSVDEQVKQYERFISTSLTHTCAYIQQLYDLQAPELRVAPPSEVLQALKASDEPG